MGGFTTALLTTALAVGGGAVANKMMSAPSQASSPMPLPKAPSVDASADKAQNMAMKKRTSATQSIYTSPLGVAGEAQIARKTLLGQ